MSHNSKHTPFPLVVAHRLCSSDQIRLEWKGKGDPLCPVCLNARIRCVASSPIRSSNASPNISSAQHQFSPTSLQNLSFRSSYFIIIFGQHNTQSRNAHINTTTYSILCCWSVFAFLWMKLWSRVAIILHTMDIAFNRLFSCKVSSWMCFIV